MILMPGELRSIVRSKMNSKRRKCYNDPNCFCYICSDYTIKEQRKPITDFMKRALE